MDWPARALLAPVDALVPLAVLVASVEPVKVVETVRVVAVTLLWPLEISQA
jgi:hypothetical protein